MISVNEARILLGDKCRKGKAASIKISNACNLVLAENLSAKVDVPLFDNSSMDGYAIKWSPQQKLFSVTNEVKAGDIPTFIINEGEAAKIFTGAAMPEKSNTVIPIEFCTIENERLKFDSSLFQVGDYMRKRGAQCAAGDRVAHIGQTVTPAMIALLASVGISEISVIVPPSVCVIISGNELQDAGETLKPGHIFDSNQPLIAAYLNQMGVTEKEFIKVSDDINEVSRAIEYAITNGFDFTLISGGISTGDYDFVREALNKNQVNELFYKVKQKPGKPLFAGYKNNQWVMALPGNPASVLTCFVIYVKPLIKSFMGNPNAWRPEMKLPLKDDYKKNQELTFFLKARIENNEIHILQGQESFNLKPFSEATALVEIPGDSSLMKRGEMVNVYLI